MEQKYDDTLDVPDEAFESLLDVFGQYQWYLDPEERPDGTQNPDFLNPDVLGYIFEKYINQKAFGAYYTRPEITKYLCDRTIDGLLLDAVNSPPEAHSMLRAEGKRVYQFETVNDMLVGMDDALCRRLLTEILPEMKLLDPACGSGAFLVAALKKMLEVYQPAIGRAKLSSDSFLKDWIRTAEREHDSLAYYLRRTVITDNLFGVDLMEEATEIAKLRLFLALVASARTVDELEPLPNVDFNVMAGNSLVGLLQVSGEDVKRYAQNDLFGRPYPELLHDKTVKTQQYRAATGLDSGVDLQQTRDAIQALRAEAQPQLDHVIAAEMVSLGVKYERATLSGGRVKYDKEKLRVEHVSALQPFHWGFEFSEILAGGGFDGILANPPWDVLKPQAKEFFQAYSDVVSVNKMTLGDFEEKQDKLLELPGVLEAWEDYLSGFKHQSGYFRNAEDYRFQSGEIDLYKLFLERSFRLMKDGGRAGIILSSGIYNNKNAMALRQMLFDQCRLEDAFCLSNERKLFDDVDHRFKFGILTFGKGGTTDSFDAAFRLDPREAIGKAELGSFLSDSSQHVEIPVSVVKRLSPDTLSIPEFKSRMDRDIASKAAAFPLLQDEDGWAIKLTNGFHSSKKDLFKTKSSKSRLPTVRGTNITHFDYLDKPITDWTERKAGRAELIGKRGEDTRQELYYQRYTLAYRRIGRSTDSRTLYAAILPPDHFASESLTVALNEYGPSDLVQLLAFFDSLVVDYFIGQRVSANISNYYVYQLPVPRLTESDPAFSPLVEAAARLTCIGDAFAPLAAAVGVEGEVDPETRAALRVEIDARVALVYGLTQAELVHILGTFPLVDEAYKDAVLLAYNALADAAQPAPDDADTARLVAAGESDRVEFKSTLRRALNPKVPDSAIEAAALKTIAAFLNTDGGTLLVGVDDDGQALGLDHDGFQTEDKLLLHLRNLIDGRLGKPAFRHLSFQVVDFGGQRVLRVDAEPSDTPVFAVEKGKETFYVRTGPSTTPLSMRETVDYVGRTFPRN